MNPQSCDTMVALPAVTRHGQTLFAKNSDRPREECQPLVQRPRASHPAGATLRTQFLEVPQAPVSYRHIGSRPYWCWGYEHGANEYQVVIGNEGLVSRFPEAAEPKLVGMEVLRLGLERGRTAAEAVDVMTALIERFGQGKFANTEGVRTYDNGYIIADPQEAFVLEAAGHQWAVKRVAGATGISNVRSIGADWTALSPSAEPRAAAQGWWRPEDGRLDFARVYGDWDAFLAGNQDGAVRRRARSCAVLGERAGQVDVRTMVALLRDHGTGDGSLAAGSEGFPKPPTICVHYTNDGGGISAASLVADLCADGSRVAVYWCGFYSPCLGVFLPVFLEGDLPPVLAEGSGTPSASSPWWQFRELERLARQDTGGEVIDDIRVTWRALEEEWLETAYDVARRAGQRMAAGDGEAARTTLTTYMAANVDRMLATLRDLIARASRAVHATADAHSLAAVP